jgi:hypothetical protein
VVAGGGFASQNGVIVSLVAKRQAGGVRGHGRRDRKRLQRALRDQDRISARLAELHSIAALLADAIELAQVGWIQHGWFAYADPSGKRRVVTAWTPRAGRAVASEPVVAACLVGAIVQAGGGPSHARSQLVERTIDLTWHASFRRPDDPVRWCPSPAERAWHVMDLVSWNDLPGRSSAEVVELLERSRSLAHTEAERHRASPHLV